MIWGDCFAMNIISDSWVMGPDLWFLRSSLFLHLHLWMENLKSLEFKVFFAYNIITKLKPVTISQVITLKTGSTHLNWDNWIDNWIDDNLSGYKISFSSYVIFKNLPRWNSALAQRMLNHSKTKKKRKWDKYINKHLGETDVKASLWCTWELLYVVCWLTSMFEIEESPEMKIKKYECMDKMFQFIILSPQGAWPPWFTQILSRLSSCWLAL